MCLPRRKDFLIQAVYEDHRGRLWVGTNGGLCFFDGKRFQNLPFPAAAIPTVYGFLQTATTVSWWEARVVAFIPNPKMMVRWTSVDHEDVSCACLPQRWWVRKQIGFGEEIPRKNKVGCLPRRQFFCYRKDVQVLPKTLQARRKSIQNLNSVCRRAAALGGGQSMAVPPGSDGNNPVTESGFPQPRRVFCRPHQRWVGPRAADLPTGCQAFRRSTAVTGCRAPAFCTGRRQCRLDFGSQNAAVDLRESGFRVDPVSQA